MEEKGYLASDLAVELALPRSTINDWLTRYADYLETETRGRRKVYSAKSLAVLREVAELRTQGAGSFEVEQTLAARHGLRPEVTAVATAAASSSSAASPEPKAASGQTLPAAPQASPVNPPALVGDKELARFAVILEELASDRRRIARRMWTIFAVALLTLIGLAVAAVWATVVLSEHFEKSKQATAEAVRSESAAAGKRMDGISAQLARSERDLSAAVVDLKGELALQQQAFMKELAAQRDAAKAERMRERNEFAARRTAELKQLEARYQAEAKRIESERANTGRELENTRRELTAKQQELAAREQELAAKEQELAAAVKSAAQPVSTKPAASAVEIQEKTK